MRNRVLSMAIVFSMLLTVLTPSVFAVGAKQAASSFLLPTTGQAMNGELGTTKSKIMAGVEVASVTTLAILGGVVGGPVIWAAAGPLIANHLWSATDAYRGAQRQDYVHPLVQQQMTDAQRTLEFSRERRFEREAAFRSDVRDRVMMAGEAARY